MYFPTPYPNEWWYSILCRYHVRSGRLSTLNTWYELCKETNRFHLQERLFPNANCYIITKQLPPGVFHLKDILCRHTLMPYYLRFYSPEEKQRILDNLLSGKESGIQIAHQTAENKQGLKFCPICYAEDTKEYGEPYWHREHQIPLMPLCPKHHCRLQVIETNMSRLDKEFLPLSKFAGTKIMMDNTDCRPWEQALSDTLLSILSLPFEMGPTEKYNNLENILKSNNLSVRLGSNKYLYIERLYQWCVEFYGESICEQLFSNNPKHLYLSSLFKWKIYTPEKYAILCVLVNLSIEDLLGPEIYGLESAKEKLLEYRNSGVVYKKYELLQLLGISGNELDLLAKKNHIKPFWDGRNARSRYLEVKVTKDEKQRIMDAIYAQYDVGCSLTVKKTAKAIREIVIHKAEAIIKKHGKQKEIRTNRSKERSNLS